LEKTKKKKFETQIKHCSVLVSFSFPPLTLASITLRLRFPMPTTIVLIPGFLTPKSSFFDYWGSAFDVSPATQVVAVSPSGVASLHDRACEIFAELTGTTVDYGAKHAKEHGHSQYGRVYNRALLPTWSESNPVHLVGHSYGGVTARYFLHLCDIGFFGTNINCNFIKSITCINSPNNGALSVYSLGQKDCTSSTTTPTTTDTKSRSKHVVTFSIGWFLGMFVHVIEYFCHYISILTIFNFGMGHWPSTKSFSGTVSSIVKKSFMFEQMDCANYDMSVHATRETNLNLKTHPTTYYISIVGSVHSIEKEQDDLEKESATDQPINEKYQHTYQPWFAWIMWCFGSMFMCMLKISTLFHHQSIKKFVKDTIVEEWQNTGDDGLVTCKSQAFPLIDSSGMEPLHRDIDSLQDVTLEPGCWYIHRVQKHHLGIVPFPKNYNEQYNFFSQLFTILQNLPSKSRGLYLG
jgi:hypothetical protein